MPTTTRNESPPVPVHEHMRRIQTDGYTVIENVVPEGELPRIRDEVVAAQARGHAASEAALAATRSRGHRIGVKGVGSLRQIINETQVFAPWLADRKLLDVVEGLFGPWTRISCTDCVINKPGNQRGYWHADWPYNQTNASHIPAPYPDTLLHLATIWMFSDFTQENGGTFIVPGSHRSQVNPSDGSIPDFDRDAPYPTERQITGKAGSVMLYDSRLWHAVAPNTSDEARIAILVRYAPWWLNLNPAQIGLPEHTMMVVETGGKNYEQPAVKQAVYDGLPGNVKPLYRHWVR